MNDILVIKCKTPVKPDKLKALRDQILKEKKEGIIILPPIFDAVVVPDNIKIVMEENNEDRYSNC